LKNIFLLKKPLPAKILSLAAKGLSKPPPFKPVSKNKKFFIQKLLAEQKSLLYSVLCFLMTFCGFLSFQKAADTWLNQQDSFGVAGREFMKSLLKKKKAAARQAVVLTDFFAALRRHFP
jgi:hypothetical protein